jgi:hypothetical protein
MNRARPELVSTRVVFTQQGFYFPRNSHSPLLLSLSLVTSSLSARLLPSFSAHILFDPSQLLRDVLIARLGFGLSVCSSRRRAAESICSSRQAPAQEFSNRVSLFWVFKLLYHGVFLNASVRCLMKYL